MYYIAAAIRGALNRAKDCVENYDGARR